MLLRSDLDDNFRKVVYELTADRVGDLATLLANSESVADAIIDADSRGHSNWNVKTSEGVRELLVMLIGQVDEGVRIGSAGNKARDTALITDKSRVKFTIPLVLPTKPPPAIHDIFLDTLVTLDEQVVLGEAKCAATLDPKTKVEVRAFARAPGFPGVVDMTVDNAVIHMSTEDVYTTSAKTVTPGPVTPASTGLQRSSRRGKNEPSSTPPAAPPPPPAPEFVGTNPVTLDTTYAASDFMDYDPARFALTKARAIQFDFRDIDNKLVPTPMLSEVFRPGTFVVCTCRLSMWKFVNRGEESHTYQLIVRSMRVIDDTPVYADYTRPVVPPSPSAGLSLRTPQKRLAEFDALDFSTPVKKPAVTVKTTLRKR
ncbi:hypothetical protein BOTBODRAFT_41841 [Botryobasidium botryosum FD-172 SS1]|uniref:Uncharacterized protein n=1 Tax=Botryobasidium botryosum (strain FD-172 SS1) TaxID=930990 RepID=A0A067MTA4_BOTB1|nr:hypothetical protein BOTBODRAFT_41841 [Botryobasidium botryosum FD-172 SS1]